MGEKQMTLVYNFDEKEVALKVMRATALIGMIRISLIDEQKKIIESESDQNIKYLRFIYPDCVSCTFGPDGERIKMTFDEFLEIPEIFLNDWLTAVYTVNPHWAPPTVITEDSQGDNNPPKVKPNRKRH